MTILIVGLTLFLGAHLIPILVPLRSRLAAGLGDQGYRGAFSIVSLIGLVLIAWGFSKAPFVHLYAPMPWARGAAHALMPVVFILLAASNTPNHIRAFLRHPMLIGIGLWAAVHLAANGDQRSVLLFGGFLAYAIIDLLAVTVQGRAKAPPTPKGKMTAIAVVAGLVLYAAVMHAHRWLFGVAVVG